MSSVILVVEHDELARETFVRMLKAMEFEAYGVGDVRDAYRVLEARPVKLIIVRLTSTDPMAIDVAIESKLRQPFIKVAVVSGGPPPQQLSPYVDLFVQKPFSLDEMRRTIAEVIADKNFKSGLF